MTIQPPQMRSRLVLEVAAELTMLTPLRQAKVLLRAGDAPSWPVALFGSGTVDGVDAVVAGEATLAIVNPSAALTLAYRGSGPYRTPQPVRTLAVMPSYDQFVFVVHPRTRLSTFEEIGTRRVPLRVGMRGQPDHSLHFMLEDVCRAAGFSTAALAEWGGELRREGGVPNPKSEKFRELIDGELDAIFDEGVGEWLEPALDEGMRVLSLAETTMQQLEGLGYRRALVSRAQFPHLAQDVLTVDFSGWAVFVHAEAPDDIVRAICAALDARKALIPWDGSGPFPIERACQNTPDAPYDVPLHPAAERYWRERGYLA